MVPPLTSADITNRSQPSSPTTSIEPYPFSETSRMVLHSDQISRSVVSDSSRPHESQHARPPCPPPTPGVHWDSRPSSQWCHPAIFLHWSPVAYWAPTDLGSFFQYPIILPFHTVHGVLKARILKWFAIPFSSGPHSVKSLHHDPPVLGCPTGIA